MDKKLQIISIGILLIIFGGGLYLFVSYDAKDVKNETAASQAASTTETAPPSTETESTASARSGQYIDYQDGIIESTVGTKVLFFYAAWCPQCRTLEADIKNSGVPDGVTIIKVDYDNSQDLKEKYGVTLQTTLVKVDDSGELQKKFVAYDNPSLDSIVRNLL